MNKAIMMLFLMQWTITPTVFSQSINWSKKILLEGNRYSVANSSDDFLQIQQYNSKDKTVQTLGFNDRIMYNGKFSYNPVPFDINTNGSIAFISLSSIDRFWTNVNLVKATPTGAGVDITDNNAILNYVGGSSSPLDHELLNLTNETADRTKELYFDISSSDPNTIRLYMYLKSQKELQVWSFDTHQNIKDTVMADAYKLYWKKESSYSFELDLPFSAFEMNEKCYLISGDGNLYKLDRELILLKNLSAPLERSEIILDKANKSAFYVPNAFSKNNSKLSDIIERRKIRLNLE